jgi:hypothetical protein
MMVGGRQKKLSVGIRRNKGGKPCSGSPISIRWVSVGVEKREISFNGQGTLAGETMKFEVRVGGLHGRKMSFGCEGEIC